MSGVPYLPLQVKVAHFSHPGGTYSTYKGAASEYMGACIYHPHRSARSTGSRPLAQSSDEASVQIGAYVIEHVAHGAKGRGEINGGVVATSP